MSLQEKTDAINGCFKARYDNVNHCFQYMFLWKWVKELLGVGHRREQRKNFPTAADQSPESASERPTCSLLVNRMMRLIKSRGAFTISDYKPGQKVDLLYYHFLSSLPSHLTIHLRCLERSLLFDDTL